jgi:hypothetical protein
VTHDTFGPAIPSIPSTPCDPFDPYCLITQTLISGFTSAWSRTGIL